jgi:hypothetical protein
VAKRKCEVCNGKRYLVCSRDDGREAIERCDNCAWFGSNDKRTLWDEDAAKLATADGFVCDTSYPYIVRQHPIYYQPADHIAAAKES